MSHFHVFVHAAPSPQNALPSSSYPSAYSLGLGDWATISSSGELAWPPGSVPMASALGTHIPALPTVLLTSLPLQHP